MPSKTFIWYAGLGLVLGLGITWFLHTHELVTEEYYRGYQGIAERNPFLAAEQLINKMGISSYSSHSLKSLDLSDFDNKITIILEQNSFPIAEIYVEQLLYWVSHGGHLIATSNIVHEETNQISMDYDDYLFQRLAVKRQFQMVEEINQVTLTANWQQYELDVNFLARYYLEIAEDKLIDYSLASEFGSHLISFNFGVGRITLATDLDFMRNFNIGQLDHAWFTWSLVNWEQPELVWFVSLQQRSIPNLLILLWQNAAQVMINILVLLLMFLWYASWRFGSILPDEQLARRSLLEHITANGYFLWQQGQAKYLLQRVYQKVMADLFIKQPHWAGLNNELLSLNISKLINLPVQDIRQALQLAQEAENISEHEFTQTIYIFHALEQKL